jgi:LPS export ABC transporter protein LptC
MKRKRNIVIIVVIAVVISSALLSLLLMKEKETEGVIKLIADKADLYVRDFHLTEVGDPDNTWDIRAESARYARNDKVVILDGVAVAMTMSDGRVYRMKGDEGTFHTDSKDMMITGNVEIVSENGDRMTTDFIRYSDREKKASTTDMVTLKNDYLTLRGVGLTVLLKKKQVTLLSKVDAVIDNRVLE